MKGSIRRAHEFDMKTLAVVVNSFAELDVTNPTLMTIAKELVLRHCDTKSDRPIEKDDNSENILPVDCAQYMTAFARCRMFQEVDLFETLENAFIQRIDEADGVTLATMFNAHAAWANHIIDEVLLKKK